MNNKIVSVDISPVKLTQWQRCYLNMRTYAEKEQHPLLDVIQSRDGTQIRICLDYDPAKRKAVD